MIPAMTAAPADPPTLAAGVRPPMLPPHPPVVRPLCTAAGGLSEAEADARRARGEGNAYRPSTSRTYWEILRQNAYPGINGILVVVSVLLLAFGMVVESLLTAGPVLANIGIGVAGESRAKRKLDRIALLSRPQARVIRDSEERGIGPAEVVLGDLLVARRGDQVVLDGTLVGDGRVELDESLLTGESDAVSKEAGDPVLSGTAVISGTAVFEVTSVGAASFANRLLAEAKRVGDERTPLQREIAATIWAVAALVLLAVVPVAIALAALPDGFSSTQTLTAAAVLVTLVPQGLAIMVTVTYATGALRISHLGALVQRQNAVESMARVDTLCMDKTGTLTTQRIWYAGADVLGDHDPGEVAAALGSLAASTTATNRTTEAIAAACPGLARTVADEIPFASERRWSGLRFADGEAWLIGAPTVLLPRSAGAGGDGRETPAGGADGAVGAPGALGTPGAVGAPGALGTVSADPGDVDARAAAVAAEGVRVLLLARAPAAAALRDAEGRPALPANLAPVALLRFGEELRPDVREILAGFARAGIELKVISGDDPATVEALARRVGLDVAGESASGPALAALGDAQAADEVERRSIFGRVEPALKARLVALLRSRRHYVAMVGDGVNDILSLRRANLGIAMESGSAAARGVADLVLLGDRFDVLPRAVIEGQRIVAAMEATLVLLLSRTFYVLLIIAGAAMAGLPFPLTPRQNSVLAFATVGIPLIVLAIWVPPRRLPRSLLAETLRVSIPVSFAVVLVALPTYAYVLGTGVSLVEAQTVLTSVTVFCGLGLLPLISSGAREESPGRLVRWWPWLLAGIMLVVYLVILALPIARDFYELTTLAPREILVLLGIGAAWTVAVHGLRRTGLVRRAEGMLVRAVRRGPASQDVRFG
jgi:cation-transporting ATPase E